MKLYDISQELFGCAVYPGDRRPRKIEDRRIFRGDLYNLSSLEMCVHNGTHIDAPFHFLPGGDTVEQLPLESCVGYCYVSAQTESIGAQAARQILTAAAKAGRGAEQRLLLQGSGVVTAEAARVFAGAGVRLIGVESQSVGPEDAPMEVHKLLLSAGTALLEGLRLSDVREGLYFLCAAPLALGGCDGAPCRALLIGD